MDKKNLFELARIVTNAKKSSPVAYSFGEENYSYSELNETLRKELNAYAGDYNLYRQNKNLLFELIEQTIDDILPARVMEQYGQFAEIKTFNQGDRPVFTQKITMASKLRARQFVTKVGLAGRYEVFKLDGRNYEMKTSAYGGAAQIGFEEFLDGRVDWAVVVDIIMEGLDRCVYLEIEHALIASIDELGGNNKIVENSFVEADMDKLISIADAYGRSSLYCTYEFAATMIPAEGWISDQMKNDKWNNGYLGNYKGHNVIIMNQSLEDETNSLKVLDPSYCWIIPTGAEKPVKIAFEGQTHVKEIESQDDWSRDIQVYRKMGVGVIVHNNICVYRNTSLTREV